MMKKTRVFFGPATYFNHPQHFADEKDWNRRDPWEECIKERV